MRKIIGIALLSIFLFTNSACAISFFHKFSKKDIRIGMTKSEVRVNLGEPTEITDGNESKFLNSDQESWFYDQGWFSFKSKIGIIFIDDKVIHVDYIHK